MFSNFFFLFLPANTLKFMMKMKKNRIFLLHLKNDREIVIGYTFRVGYTYRADCKHVVRIKELKLVVSMCSYFKGQSKGLEPLFLFPRARKRYCVK
jgi:hypothetical protein